MQSSIMMRAAKRGSFSRGRRDWPSASVPAVQQRDCICLVEGWLKAGTVEEGINLLRPQGLAGHHVCADVCACGKRRVMQADTPGQRVHLPKAQGMAVLVCVCVA